MITQEELDGMDGLAVLVAIAECDPARFMLDVAPDFRAADLHYLRGRSAPTSIYAHWELEHGATFSPHMRQILEVDLDQAAVNHGMCSTGQDEIRGWVSDDVAVQGHATWQYRCASIPSDRLGVIMRLWLFVYFRVPGLGNVQVNMEQQV